MIDFVHLHSHTYFSMRDGVSSPRAQVEGALKSGMGALAITDHDGLYGAPSFAEAAAEYGIKPIYGCELTVDDTHLTLLVENETGWANLCWLISEGHAGKPKNKPHLPVALLEGHTAGLIALSGCRQGAVARALLRGDKAAAFEAAQRYQALFGRGNYYVELQRHLQPDDNALVSGLVEIAGRIGAETVATNNVHYRERAKHELQDVLVCIKHNLSLDDNPHLRGNSEYFLKSPAAMNQLFADLPDALAATTRIAERCRYTLFDGRDIFPNYPTPGNIPTIQFLRQLSIAGAVERLGSVSEPVEQLLDHELGIIERTPGMANYILIVWDLVQFANRKGILFESYGSFAGCLNGYTLGITNVNPLEHDLLFERFLSDERRTIADIDMVFQADRREEVHRYAYEKWDLHAAMVCTFSTFHAKSAVRAIGKALSLPEDLIDRIAKAVESYGVKDLLSSPSVRDVLGDRTAEPMIARLLELCMQIEGVPSHTGIHNGGFVFTGAPIKTVIPTEPATKPGYMVIQWDKDALAAVKGAKIDVLGLEALSALAEMQDLVEAQTGERIDLKNLKHDDPAVFASITDADTIGVFQVESRAQMGITPRIKPTNDAALSICVSIIRPGPVQGQMVKPLILRWLGLEPVTYLHPLLESALKKTLGVLLFQEQVLHVAHDFAGFTPGQGDLLRRALGRKNAEEEIERLRSAFIEGAVAKGVPPDIVEQVFQLIKGFATFSFAQSHADSLVRTVYPMAMYKVKNPLAFYTALFNHQPMGFWQPAVIANDAKRHNIQMLPPDIHHSAEHCSIERGKIRIGLTYVKGFKAKVVARLLEAREQRPFTDLGDLCRRTQLPRRLIQHLILAGVLDEWGMRRQLLWDLKTVSYSTNELDLKYDEDPIEFAPLTIEEAMLYEQEILGMSLRDHVMTLYREALDQRHVLHSEGVKTAPNNARVWVSGLNINHQSPPTAHNTHFITLEDEYGLFDVIIFPKVYGQVRKTVREKKLLLVQGVVQQDSGVTNVLVERVLSLRDTLSYRLNGQQKKASAGELQKQS